MLPSMCATICSRRLLVRRDKRRRLHDLSGLAVAALRHLLGDPCFLQGVLSVRRQAFDGGDLAARHFRNGNLAGAHGLAVDVHRASAAQAGAAAEFCARELELLAHDPEQWRVGLSLDARRLAIDCE
jgi:hypothetical protein